MEELLSLRDIARELGVTRQAIQDRRRRNTLPRPDFTMHAGWPLWRRRTLERAGILNTTTHGTTTHDTRPDLSSPQ